MYHLHLKSFDSPSSISEPEQISNSYPHDKQTDGVCELQDVLWLEHLLQTCEDVGLVWDGGRSKDMDGVLNDSLVRRAGSEK